MGRLKKYQTIDEKNEVKRLRAKKYYWDNKEQCEREETLNHSYLSDEFYTQFEEPLDAYEFHRQ